MTVVVAGFDPGVSPGLATVRRLPNRYALLQAKTVRTKAADPFEQRCDLIFTELSQMLRSEMPALLTIEDQRGVHVGKWQRQADEGVQMNADNSKTLVIQGLAMACAKCYCVPYLLVQPKRAKIAVLGTGGGNAKKAAVQAAVLRLTGTKVAQDAADATALAIAGYQLACVAGHQRWASAPARRSA